MKKTWHIRKAKPGDASCLQSCMKAAYSQYRERMNGVRLPPEDVDYAFEISNYPAWVVESGTDILGGLIMVFESDQASIANIAIDPGFQGQGIGSQLVKLAESTAIDQGFSQLYLATHVLLTENIAWYRHLGWRETGRDEFRVFMKKEMKAG